ncbi:polyprotein [Bacillus paramycoides]|uniref:polyprotein n=1 Tax=Bacillus paramycoides TaxID=2026194 RepID=UPI003D062F5A
MFKWFKRWVNWHNNLDQAAIEFTVGGERVVLIGMEAMEFVSKFSKKNSTLYVKNQLTQKYIRFRMSHVGTYNRTTYKVATGEVGN